MADAKRSRYTAFPKNQFSQIDKDLVRDQFLESPSPEWSEFCRLTGYHPGRRSEFPIAQWRNEWLQTRLLNARLSNSVCMSATADKLVSSMLSSIQNDLRSIEQISSLLRAKADSLDTAATIDELLKISLAQRGVQKIREAALKDFLAISTPNDALPMSDVIGTYGGFDV